MHITSHRRVDIAEEWRQIIHHVYKGDKSVYISRYDECLLFLHFTSSFTAQNNMKWCSFFPHITQLLYCSNPTHLTGSGHGVPESGFLPDFWGSNSQVSNSNANANAQQVHLSSVSSMAGLHTIKWTVKNPFRLKVIWTHSDNGFTEQLVFAGHSHGYMLKSRWSDQLASTLIPLTTPADHSRICTQQRQQVQYVWNGPGGIKTNPKKKPSIKRDSDINIQKHRWMCHQSNAAGIETC